MKFDIISTYGHGNEQVMETIKQISSINTNDDEITFDFTQFKENNPLNILLIASSIINCKKTHSEISMKLIPKTSNDFLSHLGFYNMIGAEYGKKLGEAIPNTNYVPITKIEFDKMENGFYNCIEDKSKQMARLLYYDNDMCEFLKYAFIETIRNVYEHAETNTLFLCAQKWSSMNLVEIAIVDNGCGVASALRKQIKNKTEKQLMYMAALPGVSAKSNHTYLDKDNEWRNSGYGLFALRELTKAYGGSFILCSKNISLYQYNGKITEFDTFFEGTAVAIRFKTDRNINFSSTLSDIIKKGEEMSKNNKQAIQKASKSSGGTN